MADIVKLRPETPESPFDKGDEFLLKIIRDWLMGKAEQEAEWARYDFATAHGHRTDTHEAVNFDGLNKMGVCEEYLAKHEPRSVLVATELLKVAAEMIAHKAMYPEHVFSNGPAFEIVRNVTSALGRISGTTKLTREAWSAGSATSN